MRSDKEDSRRGARKTGEPEELGVPVWTEGIVPPPSSDLEDWEDAMPALRERWHARFGATPDTHRWEDYEPGYRYGWEMSSRPEYRGRNWSELEPEFRRDWERRYRDKPWDDRVSESVRHAWEDVTEPSKRESHSDSGDPAIEIDYDVVGGENYPPHEHRFVGERCEVCGAVRRYGRVA